MLLQTDRPLRPQFRRQLSDQILLGLVLFLSFMAMSCQHKPPVFEIPFDIHEIDIGSSRNQVVLPGSFLDQEMYSFAVVRVEPDGTCWLGIYAHNGATWVLEMQAKLRPGITYVDVVRIDGATRLITFANDRLCWWDPSSGKEKRLASLPSCFRHPKEDTVAWVDVSHDVNGDGLDDLVIPDRDGFRLLVQKENGRFSQPVFLAAETKYQQPQEPLGVIISLPTQVAPWGESPFYSVDQNLDGRLDLMAWRNGYFEVFHQQANGEFPHAGKRINSPIAFSETKLNYWRYGISKKALNDIQDLNQDGLADMVLFSYRTGRKGWTWLDYFVHFGERSPDGALTFSNANVAKITRRTSLYSLKQLDLNGNGQKDAVFHMNDPNIYNPGGLVWPFFKRKDYKTELRIYTLKNGAYPQKPEYSNQITITLFKQKKRGFFAFPAVLLGDLTGDRHIDLVLQKGRNELLIFPGVSSPELFDQSPQRLWLDLPLQGSQVRLADLNHDGKQDIYMHHVEAKNGYQLKIILMK